MKRKRIRNLDYSMAFELAMMQFFGEKAHHIASYAGNKILTKKWLLKSVKRMMRNVDDIDTTVRHKESMFLSLEYLESAIKDWDIPEKIIFDLFMLCSRFLGYDGCKARCYTPVYWQTQDQYFTTTILQGRSAEEDYRGDKKNIISARKKLIENLKREGYNDFKISLILNTTEYEIKNLKKE